MKFVVVFLLVMVSKTFVIAQQSQDTLWFDANWKQVNKEQAVYFRPKPLVQDSLYVWKDFFVTGLLQMQGASHSDVFKKFEGLVTWYYEDGTIQQEVEFQNGLFNGRYVSYSKEGKVENEGFFQTGKLESGAYDFQCPGYRIQEEIIQDSLRKRVYYEKDPKGIRFEQVTDKSTNQQIYSNYYDAKGKIFGSLEFKNNVPLNGIEVYYRYNPMRISSVTIYKNGASYHQSHYYSNGQAAYRIFEKPKPHKVYYDVNGKKIARIDFSGSVFTPRPYEGVELFFYSMDSPEQDFVHIKQKSYYQNGLILKKEEFDPLGNLQGLIVYSDSENNQPKYQISYSPDKRETDTLFFKGYLPYQGRLVSDIEKSTYEGGTLLTQEKYDSDQRLLSRFENSQTTYFSKEGEVIGKLQMKKSEYGEDFLPFEGVKIILHHSQDRISDVEEYKDGQLIMRTAYNFQKNPDSEEVLVFKRIEKYENRTTSYEAWYFSNGELQQEFFYLPNSYEKSQAKFYNKQGELIGEFDYKTKTGTEYAYLSNSDEYESIRKFEKGKLLYEINYGSYYNYEQKKQALVLYYEIDYNGVSKIYDKTTGSLQFEGLYKEGKPYSGQLFDPQENGNEIICTYVDGVKDGPYTRYAYNGGKVLERGMYRQGKLEGIVTLFHTRTSEKVSETLYKNGEREGESLFFDEGKVVSRLVYRDDKPFEGIVSENAPYHVGKKTLTEYASGKIVQVIKWEGESHMIEKYGADGRIKTFLYEGENGNQPTVIFHQKRKDILDGSYQFFSKNGSVKYEAEFENGDLKSGIALFRYDRYEHPQVPYVLVEKEEDSLSISLFDEKNTLRFRLWEDLSLTLGSRPLASDLNAIYNVFSPRPEDLYGKFID